MDAIRGAFAVGSGLVWASAVWVFQMSELKQLGAPAKARPKRVSLEKPHLVRGDTTAPHDLRLFRL